MQFNKCLELLNKKLFLVVSNLNENLSVKWHSINYNLYIYYLSCFFFNFLLSNSINNYNQQIKYLL